VAFVKLASLVVKCVHLQPYVMNVCQDLECQLLLINVNKELLTVVKENGILLLALVRIVE